MSQVTLFLSAVSDEFVVYREYLRHQLERHNVSVKIQEDFIALGDPTLLELNAYIANCDAVIHLVGDMTGSDAHPRAKSALLQEMPELRTTMRISAHRGRHFRLIVDGISA